MHRLEAFVQVTIFDDQRKGAQLFGFEARRHGEIRMIPIAEHAQALEFGALQIDLLERIFAARRAKRLGVDFLSDAAVGLLDLHFNRQAVAIPAGHIGGIVAIQGARFDDDVLENLVERMP